MVGHVLCSHKEKFIYIKTKKTASTSVEILLEPFCLDSPRPAQEHSEMVVNASGVVGYRGRDWQGKPFYNHMPARDILALLGADIFWSYKKLCVVRNPFDKAVSMFWFLLPAHQRQELQSAPFNTVMSAFSRFIRSEHDQMDRLGRNNCCDWHIYTIDDKLVADEVLRYENLDSDLEEFRRSQGLKFDIRDISFYKSGFRLRKEHFVEYYDDEARAIARELFRNEIKHFHYELTR